MLRRGGQLLTYQSDGEQLEIRHKLVRGYRRRVINAELPHY